MAQTPEEKLAKAREKNRRWREANRDKAREASKRWHERNRAENRERVAETTARYRQGQAAKYWLKMLGNRAEKHGRDFDLTEEFLQELLAPMTCSATGLKLSYEWGGEGRTNPWAPSVDRVSSAGGYTMDNVRVVCWAYNMAKNDWADDVVLALAHAVVEAADADS